MKWMTNASAAVIVGLLLTTAPLRAEEGHFSPGHLAVLRAGDGAMDLHLKQSPVFVDQFDTTGPNSKPSFSVAIPTNGPASFFFNGHAATEGMLSRSADHKMLAFAGYGGMDLLQMSGTAARLDLERGACTVDNMGTVHTFLYKSDTTGSKVNPRAVVTDGSGGFWGSGNAGWNFYFTPADGQVVKFAGLASSRSARIIDHTLYFSLNTADAQEAGQPGGIVWCKTAGLPKNGAAEFSEMIPCAAEYKKTSGFDINPKGTVAYVADISAGIQKYVKDGESWSFAYNISIPQVISKADNNAAGVFALTADFGGSNAVIYATTTEGYGGSVNSNRVVKIVDIGANSAVSTLVQAPSTNIAYRGIEFTPEP